MNISKTLTFGSFIFTGAGGSSAALSWNFSNFNYEKNLILKNEALINKSEQLAQESKIWIREIRNEIKKHPKHLYIEWAWIFFVSKCYSSEDPFETFEGVKESKKNYEDFKKIIKEVNPNDNNLENILQKIENLKTKLLKISKHNYELVDEEYKLDKKLNEVENLVRKKISNYEDDVDIRKLAVLVKKIWKTYEKYLNKRMENSIDDDLENEIFNKKQKIMNLLKKKKFENVEKELRICFNLFVQRERIFFFKNFLDNEIWV